MRTTRRRIAAGAIGASVLLFTAACTSTSDDAATESSIESVTDSSAESPVENTATPGTASPGTASPGTATPAEATTTPTDAAPTPTDAAVVVPEALQFTAPLVGGGTFDGAAAAGKPTVFWFWAPT